MPRIESLSGGTHLVLPESTRHAGKLLLTFPSIGDTAKPEGFLPPGNSLNDALPLADVVGVPVLVAERWNPRLLAAWRGANRSRSAALYNELAKRRAEALAVELHEAGGDMASSAQLCSYAESGGATHALAIARSRELPMASLALNDPVGLFNTNFWTGLAAYYKYTFWDEPRFKRQHRLPEQIESYDPVRYAAAAHKRYLGIVAMIGRQLRDIGTSGRAWASNVSLDAIIDLRDNEPRIGMAIDFPESSLALLEPLTDRRDVLAKLREAPGHRQAPYEIREQAGWSHGTINVPAAHLELARRAIAFSSAA